MMVSNLDATKPNFKPTSPRKSSMKDSIKECCYSKNQYVCILYILHIRIQYHINIIQLYISNEIYTKRYFCILLLQDYIINLRSLVPEEGICEVPSNLFSLQTLTHCMLKHLELSLPPNFCGFKYLYQIDLSHVKVDSGKLENLISLSPSHVARLEPEPELLNELECISFCHNKLKTVEIEVKTPYKHALGLICFLLANSSSLEILKFKVDPGIDKLDIPLMLSTSQDLLEMERATPRVHVKFIYPHFIVIPVPSCTEDPSSKEATFLGIKLFIFDENCPFYIPPTWPSYKVNEDRQNQPSHEHESDFTDPWQKLYFLNV
ncbi:unnamed protein product [Lupinus luteus]|uniref:FBD domain-containing protein n=1 Tax=Lupinus luteus TaxID=3873 RepID=A0AAV1X271_LUPLU